jgi:hypothetical protein
LEINSGDYNQLYFNSKYSNKQVIGEYFMIIIAICITWYLIGFIAAFCICKIGEGKVLVKDLPLITFAGIFGLLTAIVAICEWIWDSKFGNRKLF